MLPGQTVNVLEVPTESKPPTDISPSSSVDSLIIFTLNPKDKYLAQGTRRTASTSAIRSRKSTITTTLTLKSGYKAPSIPSDTRDCSTRIGPSSCSRPRSLASVFDVLRQTRSAGSSTKSGFSWPRKLFSRSDFRAENLSDPEHAEDMPPVPRIPSWIPGPSAYLENDLNVPMQEQHFSGYRSARTPDDVVEPRSVSLPREMAPYAPNLYSSEGALSSGLSPNESSEASPLTKSITPLSQLKENNAFFAEEKPFHSRGISRENLTSAIASQAGPTISMRRGFGNQALYWERRAFEQSSSPKVVDAEPVEPGLRHTNSSKCSYATSDYNSPYLTSTTTVSGLTSPVYLSQPETPVVHGFETDFPLLEDSSITHDETDRPDEPASNFAKLTFSDMDQSIRPHRRTTDFPPASGMDSHHSPEGADPIYPESGFQVYSLPDAENTSMLTIRKLPSTTFQRSDSASQFGQQAKQEMVQAWDDGTAQHRLSALEELMEDCGYLGRLIN